MILYDAFTSDDTVELMRGMLLKVQAQYNEA